MHKAVCPVCLHKRALQARLGGYEPCFDDGEMMDWHKPLGGPRGQQCSRLDGGFWVCPFCGVILTPEEAGVLLDAVLMVSFPDCDSIVGGLHTDTREALKGGPGR